jgi:WD40 repeat protein
MPLHARTSIVVHRRHATRSWLLVAIAALLAPVAQAGDEPRFLQDVAPVLTRRCTGCHGAQKAKGDYRLHTFNELLKHGASDGASVVPGKPDESELFRRISGIDAAKRMPPGDDPLGPDDIVAIRQWIAAGAAFDGKDRDALLKSILPPRRHPDAPAVYSAPVPVFALAFAPDGDELAVGGYHEVTIWDPKTGKLLRRIGRLPQRIQSLAFSRDGSRLLVAGGTPGEYGEVMLVDPKRGTKVHTFGTFGDIVLGAAFSPDGGRVVAGSSDRSVRVFRVADGQTLWQQQLHSDWVTAVAYSPDNKFVVSASKDKTVKVLDAETGALFTTYNGHCRQYAPHVGRFDVYDVTFGQDGSTAYSAGEGAAIRVWNPEQARTENGTAGDMEARFVKAGHTRYLEASTTKPVFRLVVRDGQVFSAAGDKMVRQHDAASGRLVRTYQGHGDWVYAVDYHQATGRLASGAFDGEVRVWDTATGECVCHFQAAPR